MADHSFRPNRLRRAGNLFLYIAVSVPMGRQAGRDGMGAAEAVYLRRLA